MFRGLRNLRTVGKMLAKLTPKGAVVLYVTFSVPISVTFVTFFITKRA